MKQCGEHTVHAYINQLAEHDVVSCLHFLLSLFFYRFSSCRSFAPHHISPIPFHFSGFFWFEALRRGSRKIHHTWRTQKKGASVCGALYLKQHHVTYSHCNVYITFFICLLICGAQHFFHLSYCHCRIHLKPISFGVHSLLTLEKCRS